jgi:hypothetical protein
LKADVGDFADIKAKKELMISIKKLQKRTISTIGTGTPSNDEKIGGAYKIATAALRHQGNAAEGVPSIEALKIAEEYYATLLKLLSLFE